MDAEHAEHITGDRARRFVDDGYLVVPDLVEVDLVDAMRAEAVRSARGDLPVTNFPTFGPDADGEDPYAWKGYDEPGHGVFVRPARGPSTPDEISGSGERHASDR